MTVRYALHAIPVSTPTRYPSIYFMELVLSSCHLLILSSSYPVSFSVLSSCQLLYSLILGFSLDSIPSRLAYATRSIPNRSSCSIPLLSLLQSRFLRAAHDINRRARTLTLLKAFYRSISKTDRRLGQRTFLSLSSINQSIDRSINQSDDER